MWGQQSNPNQTFATLLSFDGDNGSGPGALTQGTDGSYYGTTASGGATCTNGCGVVFKFSNSGLLTKLYDFAGTEGEQPAAPLVLGTDGNFYGTTDFGGASVACGASGCGTVFKITRMGELTTLHSFDGTDGEQPAAPLVLGIDGNFYGTTVGGGTNSCNSDGCGTVFKMTPAGMLSTLHAFDSTGWGPTSLLQGKDGNLYGSTMFVGTGGCGTVYRLSLAGKLTTLHTFDGTDGCEADGLMQGRDGNLYGSTGFGGPSSDGTVFQLTTIGALNTLHSFSGPDGNSPVAELIQATDGNLYGVSNYGGASDACGSLGCGTVFEITPGGAFTSLHSFDETDGANPGSRLLQATNGNLYGTTTQGGSNDKGTIFDLSVGLGPFVSTNPTSGKAGQKVTILGNNLKDTASINFNGTAATIISVTNSAIVTTVPIGATTGFVKLTTSKTVLKSNVPFRVR
jgi:uncharacterized repeat protein (TIGR03803 family)